VKHNQINFIKSTINLNTDGNCKATLLEFLRADAVMYILRTNKFQRNSDKHF